MRAEYECEKCRVAKYCCKGCQQTDWERGHKTECDMLVGMPYTESQRKYIYARGGHITQAGHASWPRGTEAWPKPRK